MKRRISICAFSVWTSWMVVARGEPFPSTISVHVQALSSGALEVSGLFWMPGAEMEPLRVPTEFLPASESYTGPNPIHFFRQAPPEEAGEEPRFFQVAQVRIPEDSPQVVILFSERAQGLLGVAVPLAPQTFPVGSYLVFNQSGQEVVLNLDQKAITLAQGAVQIIRPDNRGRRPVPVALRYVQDSENSSLITSTWFYHPERRRLVFLLQDENRIQVRGITWFPGRQD